MNAWMIVPKQIYNNRNGKYLNIKRFDLQNVHLNKNFEIAASTLSVWGEPAIQNNLIVEVGFNEEDVLHWLNAGFTGGSAGDITFLLKTKREILSDEVN